MIATKNVYRRRLLLYLIALPLCALIIALSYRQPYGYILTVFCLALDIYYVIKIFNAKKTEKRCTVCDGRFIGMEKSSLLRRFPKFSITVEIDFGDKKVLLKTEGIYSASDISGLTDKSVVKIGYTENFGRIITL